ncbi:MAG: NAD(P)H-hydrate dehydratase [Coraliomargarita sp.]
MNLIAKSPSVLSCQQAAEFESKVLADEAAEWAAMKQAGRGIASAVQLDFRELREVPQYMRILVLVGKGNNGGDALIACGELLADYPRASATLLLLESPDEMGPLAQRALNQLEGRVRTHQPELSKGAEPIHALLDEISEGNGFEICIDGLLGMAFKAPLRENARQLIDAINSYAAIELRAAVDLPSGKGDVSDETFFQADFTYATGIPKLPIFDGASSSGRIRYIDLGFYKPVVETPDAVEHILTDELLQPLRRLRHASSDKRDFGHLFIVGGSAHMPGALLMTVQAAVRSGVGRVTAFAPASVASSLAAQVPEAMWIPWPETQSGTLNPRAMQLLLERVEYADVVVAGPGMGSDRNTEMVAQEIVNLVDCPVVLDADALREKVIGLAMKRRPHQGPVVVTPHMGEYMRMAKLSEADWSSDVLISFCKSYNCHAVLKGPLTQVCDGEKIYINTFGGPVLSRGGSGDLLVGLIGGMIAQDASHVADAIGRGIVLHGSAAERLAREFGQVAVHTTRLLEFLPAVLRG